MGQPVRSATLGLSVDEFLAWEMTQTERHEFIRGEVFAMAGAEDRHVTVTLNVAMALRQHLAGSPCRTFMTDMKLQVGSEVFYPDVLVTCSNADRERRLSKCDPKLIVEVLSPSTAAYDRGEKFAQYRRIEALRELALIDIETRRTDVFRKRADGLWVLHPFDAGAAVLLDSVGVSIEAAVLFAEIDDAEAMSAEAVNQGV